MTATLPGRPALLAQLLAPAVARSSWMPTLDPRKASGWETRAEAAGDLTLDRDAFETFARDSSKQVRQAVLRNPRLPSDLAVNLKSLGKGYGRGPNEERLRLLHPTVSLAGAQGSLVGPLGLASYPTSPTDMLLWLATGDDQVAAVVADRTDLDTHGDELLRYLTELARSSTKVATALATNPVTPSALLTELVDSGPPASDRARLHPAVDLGQLDLPASAIDWAGLRCWALPRLTDEAAAATFARLAVGWSNNARELLDTSHLLTDAA